MAAICDLHNHILPDMDDGCATLEESLRVLASAARQGVYHIIATPHYYPEERVEDFLQRRCVAEKLLRRHLPEDMHLCVGAEVAWFDGISRCEQLDSLCIGKSRYLLLELPFSSWNRNLLREIGNLCRIRGVIPIIAHIERYLLIQSKSAIKELLSNDVLVQMNAGQLLHWSTGFQARRMLKNGMVQLLGTDCHNTQTRPFNLGRAMKKMRSQALSAALANAALLSMEIYHEAVGADDHGRKEIR